jgi:hypothetical protein
MLVITSSDSEVSKKVSSIDMLVIALMFSHPFCSAAGTGTPTSGTGGSTGVDGPPGMGLGPSSFNDNSGASLLPEVGTAMWILILACSIMVLNFS